MYPPPPKVATPAWSTTPGTKSGSFTALGILPVLETTDQFRQFVAADVSRSAELLKEAGFKPE